ncbi:amino acid adenylation domain-containing protein, partial [Dactylosporangium siamense]
MRDRSRTPLFQVLFNYATTDGEPGAPQEEAVPTPALYDLSLTIAETGTGLFGGLEYSTQLFDEVTVRRMIGHLSTLLESVASAPDRALSQLPMLSAAELGDLELWSGTALDPPAVSGVHELIAGHDGSAVAVWATDEQLTYAELDERSGRLAARLRGMGVGAETVVGLCLPRGADLVVAIVAVWKAGGAYLALDAQYPPERLAFLLTDAGVSVLVADRSVAGSLPEVLPAVLWWDAWPAATAPDVDVNPAQSACVIYTSGSTGLPKGAVVSHGALLGEFAAWSAAHFRSGDRLRWLTLASASFDVFTGDVVRALGAGGTLVVGEVGAQLDIPRWCSLLRAQEVQAFESAPRYVDELVDHLERGGLALPALRLVVVTTDVWRWESAQRARRVLGAGVRVLTAYGVTEATIDSTFWPVSERSEDQGPVPIGGPLPGVRLQVLDRYLSAVPVGAVGELFIGGVGLARGYLGRPALTAERFVAAAGGGRWYRTGDRVRRGVDGGLLFLGRADDQVKVRGFRVEPGEVEHALEGHPAVAAAVVVSDGGDRLVAYVVPRGALAVEQLRAFLAGRLPEYLIPAVFVQLATLPLTPNGKVDRAGLAVVDGSRLELSGGYVAPVGAVQDLLAGIWAGLLDVERVGATDNFFDLGGHSLLATRVVSRIRAVLEVEVPVAALFDAPTVAGLSRVIEAAAPGMVAPAIVPVERGRPLPLSFAQQRLWFLHRLEPGSVEYNMPMAVRLPGDVDREALIAALTALVARHEVLRTRLVAGEDGVPYQVVDPAPERFDLPVVDGIGPEEPFDLAAGPLFRASWLRDEQLLVLAMHHVVGDEWSAGVLQRELRALYAGEVLAPLPVQYADFAVWQRQWLSGEVLEGQLGFWRERLAGAAVLDLPSDRPRPAVRSSAGQIVEFGVDPVTVAGLEALSRSVGATMFMTLLGAFATLLGRYSGQDDVVVGTPIAGRNRAEVEGLIGFFVNTLVLRTDLSGDPTFAELLGRVRADALAAFAHQDAPFERLVDELDVQRDRSRTPLFQVFYSYTTDTEDLGEPLSFDPQVKFDLSLDLVERPDGALVGGVQYATALFDRSTVERLVGHLLELLTTVARDADRRLSSLGMVTAAEALELAAWNDTAAPVPTVGGVHELISARAVSDPDVVAVVCGAE